MDMELDPFVVPIGDIPPGSFKDWLASLECGEEATVLSVSAAPARSRWSPRRSTPTTIRSTRP